MAQVQKAGVGREVCKWGTSMKQITLIIITVLIVIGYIKVVKVISEKKVNTKMLYDSENCGEFTNLNEGHCSYWNQDIKPYYYTKIDCWKWLDIVMDNPNEYTECIVRKCEGALRHTPNVIRYKGQWSVIYGWTSPGYNIGDEMPCIEIQEECYEEYYNNNIN